MSNCSWFNMSSCLLIFAFISGCTTSDRQPKVVSGRIEYSSKYICPGYYEDPIISGLVMERNVLRGVICIDDELKALSKKKCVEVLKLLAKPKKCSDAPLSSIGPTGPSALESMVSVYIHMENEMDIGFDICDTEYFLLRGEYYRIPAENGRKIFKVLGIPESSDSW